MSVKIKGITRRRVTRRIDRATRENFEENVLNERTQAWLRYDSNCFVVFLSRPPPYINPLLCFHTHAFYRYEAGKVMGPKIIKKVRRRADELGITIPEGFFPGRNRYKYKRKQTEIAAA